MLYEERIIEITPAGPSGPIPLENCTEPGNKVGTYLVDWKRERESEYKSTIASSGYQGDSYTVSAITPGFGAGEGKGLVTEPVKDDNLYTMVDVCNYSLTHFLFGMIDHMSPGDHFQNLKRVIMVVIGKAHRINVIVPFLYESHQHRRSGRESLDCALVLKELASMGVENTTASDTHGPRVQDTVPSQEFEAVQPIHQFLKYLSKNETDLQIDSSHTVVISPDGGGMGRTVYFVNMLGLDTGMLHKRHDYMKIVGGRDSIVAYEFLGVSMEGKDVLIIDDMISSGEGVTDMVKELRRRKVGKVFMCAIFGLFIGGLTKFGEYRSKEVIDWILITNLVYQTPGLFERSYYTNINMSKYTALITDNLNHGASPNDLLTPTKRINRLLVRYRS